MKCYSIVSLALFLFIGAFTTSCYRMPGEDEYSLVPTTNNPSATRQRGEGLTPKMAY